MMSMRVPALTVVFSLAIQVAEPLPLGTTGAGTRRIVPILGGRLDPAPGSGLPAGRILPGGADVQLIRACGDAVLDARYAIELDDGAAIYVNNQGLRTGPADVLRRLNGGEEVDPALVYFRTTPVFETAAEPHLWLATHLFVASGRRFPSRVELDVFMVG